jgi:hypothetical protein
MKNFKTIIVVLLIIAGILIALFPPSQAILTADSDSIKPILLYLGRVILGVAIFLLTALNADRITE